MPIGCDGTDHSRLARLRADPEHQDRVEIRDASLGIGQQGHSRLMFSIQALAPVIADLG